MSNMPHTHTLPAYACLPVYVYVCLRVCVWECTVLWFFKFACKFHCTDMKMYFGFAAAAAATARRAAAASTAF